MNFTRIRVLFVAVVAVLCMSMAPAAFAQESTQGGYPPTGNEQVEIGGESGTGGPTATPSTDNGTPSNGAETAQASPSGSGGGPSGEASSGSLPFTGLDLGFMLAAGVTLLAAGLALRRMARGQHSA